MDGTVKGSIIHIHRARTVIIDSYGLITASNLGNFIIEIILRQHGTCFHLLIVESEEALFFQVAVKVLERETIQMELVVVLGMGVEGALDISMGE